MPWLMLPGPLKDVVGEQLSWCALGWQMAFVSTFSFFWASGAMQVMQPGGCGLWGRGKKPLVPDATAAKAYQLLSRHGQQIGEPPGSQTLPAMLLPRGPLGAKGFSLATPQNGRLWTAARRGLQPRAAAGRPGVRRERGRASWADRALLLSRLRLQGGRPSGPDPGDALLQLDTCPARLPLRLCPDPLCRPPWDAGLSPPRQRPPQASLSTCRPAY